ncbi:MAG: hypothetical protein ACLVDP_20040 [Flavonifractor plautii]
MYSRETPALPPAAHAQGPPAPQCGALLLLPWPCCSSSAPASPTRRPWSGSRAASHFGPVDLPRWYPEEAIYALRYDRWYAVLLLERQPFFLRHTWRPMPED